MGCLSGLAKYILFLFNFVIAICALIFLIFGILIIVDEHNSVKISDSFSVGGFTIAIGVIIFLIAFFGCCGAIKENNCMLTTYAIVLIVLLVLQIALAIVVFIQIRGGDTTFYDYIYKQVEKIYERNDQVAIDAAQTQFKCCGPNGPQYYGLSFPSSCCENQANPCIIPYTTGCARKITDSIEKNIKIIGGVAIGFAVVELLGAIFAFMIQKKGYYA